MVTANCGDEIQGQGLGWHSNAVGHDAGYIVIVSSCAQVPKRAAPGGGGRPAGGAARKAALVWFRNDLRLHDNPALEQVRTAGRSGA